MLELRPYRAGDAQTIVGWIDNETTFYRWSAGRYGAYPIGPEVLEAAYAQPGPEGPFPMVMTDDDVPVGHLILRYPDAADHGVIRLGFVLLDSARRGRGDGKQLLRFALAHAFGAMQARQVTIGVFADNAPALNCYLKVGFHVVEGMTEDYAINGQIWTCLELAMDRGEFKA